MISLIDPVPYGRKRAHRAIQTCTLEVQLHPRKRVHEA